jgi:hypothetical protein
VKIEFHDMINQWKIDLSDRTGNMRWSLGPHFKNSLLISLFSVFHRAFAGPAGHETSFPNPDPLALSRHNGPSARRRGMPEGGAPAAA